MLSDTICRNRLIKRIESMYPDKLDSIAYYIDNKDVLEYRFRYVVDGRHENLVIIRATGYIYVEGIEIK